MSGTTRRGPGRPADPVEVRTVPATVRLSPEERAAWKASGRTLIEVVRAGLGLTTDRGDA